MNPTIPKDAETLIASYKDDFNADSWSGDSWKDTEVWLRSALQSYALHLAGVLPIPCETFDNNEEMGRAFNEGVEECRSAILKEAGIELGVKGE